MIDLLEKALLWDSNKSKYWYLTIHALFAYVLDVFVAHTSWVDIAGKPLKGEWTISDTLERLCLVPGDKQQLYIEIGKEINRHSPTKDHIKAVLVIPK